jgi:hypothetical protein
MGCHDGTGVHSILSRSQLFSPRALRPPDLNDSHIERIERFAIGWKERQFS